MLADAASCGRSLARERLAASTEDFSLAEATMSVFGRTFLS